MLKRFAALSLFAMIFSCGKEALPKPSGELRLEYPSPAYKPFAQNAPYDFEISKFAKVAPGKKPNWFYIIYPKMKAKIFVTYFPVNNDLSAHFREAEKLVYEHTVKASAIETKSFRYPESLVYGNFYELQGQTASNIQFYATDSLRHFVTANLYFNSRPKPDSLAPAVDYIRKDMLHMLDTFQWK